METIAGRPVDQARLATVCERWGVATLSIFGSVARGDAVAGSDVDLLYELLPGRRLGWQIEYLADELAEVFGHPVDLVSSSGLHPRLRPVVMEQARVLYAA